MSKSNNKDVESIQEQIAIQILVNFKRDKISQLLEELEILKEQNKIAMLNIIKIRGEIIADGMEILSLTLKCINKETQKAYNEQIRSSANVHNWYIDKKGKDSSNNDDSTSITRSGIGSNADDTNLGGENFTSCNTEIE